MTVAGDVTLTRSQRPLLVIVEVGVSSDAWPRGEGVSQEAVLAVEGVTISVFCWWRALSMSPQQLED